MPPQPPDDQVPSRLPSWRRWLEAVGTAPDPRFTLANERTFLAWIRTALAVLAAGLALDAVQVEVLPDPVRVTVAVVLVSLGTVMALTAFGRWVGIERSLRRRGPLPLPSIAPLLALGVGLCGFVVVGYLVLT